jgi:cytoskeletal protein RodZ
MSPKMKFSKDELKMPQERFGIVEEHSSHLGIILAILIIFLMLIFAGLYVWGTFMQEQQNLPLTPQVERPSAQENNEPESTNAEADVETITAQSTSDEIATIDSDLQSTLILPTLDAELSAIEAELNRPQ